MKKLICDLQDSIEDIKNKLKERKRIKSLFKKSRYKKLKEKYEHAEKMRQVWENNCQIHEKELSMFSENARYDNRYIHYLQGILKQNNIEYKSTYDFEK